MRRLVFFVLLSVLLTAKVYATDSNIVDTEALIKGLPEEAAEMVEDLTPDASLSFTQAVQNILGQGLSSCTDAISEGLSLCVMILAIVFLCSLCLRPNSHHDIRLCLGAIGLFTAVMGSFRSMIRLAELTVEKLRDYSGLLLPVMSTALAVSGAPGTATALQGVTVLFSRILMGSMIKYLFPCVYFYLMIGAAEAALSNKLLSELRELVGWVVEKSLRIILYSFTAFLSLSGVISGKADALAVKATKAAISGMVPVVGSILSDASETLLAGASLVKHTAGIFGLLAVLAIAVTPFLKIAVQYLLMKCTAACAGTVGLDAHVSYLKHISTAMGYVLAMTGICTLLLLVSGVCYLQVSSV